MGTSVGIVGVGNMGGGMAARLLDRGYAVLACDLVSDRVEALVRLGARAAAAPAQAAAGAQALIVCAVDAGQAREVLFGAAGAAAALPPGAAVLLCPTIAPGDVEDIAARLTAQGLLPIDAPMSGGPARARDGSMSLMVACAEAGLAPGIALEVVRAVGKLERHVARGERYVGEQLAAIHPDHDLVMLELAQLGRQHARVRDGLGVVVALVLRLAAQAVVHDLAAHAAPDRARAHRQGPEDHARADRPERLG